MIYISSGMVFESWRLLEGSSEAGGLGYVLFLSLLYHCVCINYYSLLKILTKEFKGSRG